MVTLNNLMVTIFILIITLLFISDCKFPKLRFRKKERDDSNSFSVYGNIFILHITVPEGGIGGGGGVY